MSEFDVVGKQKVRIERLEQYISEQARQFSELLEDNNRLCNPWISVEDELPRWGYVIAFRPDAPKGNEVATVQYNPHHLGFYGNFEVTHWMPLPKPPKESNDE